MYESEQQRFESVAYSFHLAQKKKRITAKNMRLQVQVD